MQMTIIRSCGFSVFLLLLSLLRSLSLHRPHLRLKLAFRMSIDDAMIPTYDRLAERCLERFKQDPSRQCWIGIAGGPGSGKSTLASAVCAGINSRHSSEIAVVIPMDGYHYSRSQLREMGAKGERSFDELIARRGSPWTFDAEKLVEDLRVAKSHQTFSFPIYSRQLSDPVPGETFPDRCFISRQRCIDGVQLSELHRIVLVEGNYLLNWEDSRWSGLREVFDERWFIRCVDKQAQRQRLVRRHLETWTEEKTRIWGEGEIGAGKKADANDVLNAEFIESHSRFADLIIDSM